MQRIEEVTFAKRLKWLIIIIGVVLLTIVGALLLHHDVANEEKAMPASLSRAAESVSPSPVAEKESAAEAVLAAPEEAGQQIDLNHASLEELKTLPGIGDAIGKRIIDYREKTPFKVVLDLKKVSGIGEKKFQAIRDLVCVSLPE